MVLSAAQVADAPPGLTNSIKISVTTAQASVLLADNVVLYTPIEGFRTSRLQFGTANAQAISLGFWTKIHRVGTYSGSVRNAAQNRSYPFNFTQNVADTWEFKTVTVPGDITGTWVGNTNGTGLTILFCMAGGSGVLGTANTWAAANLSGVTGTTNGVAATSDTFQITGVIVLPGSDAPSAARSPFIMRPYDQELQICRRYFQWNRGVVNDAFFLLANANFCLGPYKFAPQMRAVPTVTIYDGTTSGQALTFGGGTVGGVTAYSAVLGSDGLGAVQAAAFTAAVSFNVKADARL